MLTYLKLTKLNCTRVILFMTINNFKNQIIKYLFREIDMWIHTGLLTLSYNISCQCGLKTFTPSHLTIRKDPVHDCTRLPILFNRVLSYWFQDMCVFEQATLPLPQVHSTAAPLRHRGRCGPPFDPHHHTPHRHSRHLFHGHHL